MNNLTSFRNITAVVPNNMLVGPSKNMATFHPFNLKLLIRNCSTTRDENSVVAMNWTGLHFERRSAQAYDDPWWHQNVMRNIPQCNIVLMSSALRTYTQETHTSLSFTFPRVIKNQETYLPRNKSRPFFEVPFIT